MSLRFRRAAAVLSLALAFFLILPAPSSAAGLWQVPSASIAARIWSWLENFGFVKPAAFSRRPAAWWEKQGSAIDPDGQPVAAPTSPVPSDSSTSDEGSMIDPNGGKG